MKAVKTMKAAGFLKLAVVLTAMIILAQACGPKKVEPQIPTDRIDFQEQRSLKELEKAREEHRKK